MRAKEKKTKQYDFRVRDFDRVSRQTVFFFFVSDSVRSY